nr:PREDICTED: scavenger receptor cysteine-rich type 1 protein M160-like isoform X1 [Lepisosteus oculatus]XP_015199413.1 PREDICTED: scavenger receptor cysteine-rich type 1 protein M160-like isoform X1 [Lepisosteus oculatus]
MRFPESFVGWRLSAFLWLWTVSEAQRLRLHGGDKPCVGRLEVFHKGEWGVVCNDKWSEVNSAVVCRSLECGQPVRQSTIKKFPHHTKRVWMNEVNCTGRERHLWNCSFSGWGMVTCDVESHHVNVECSGRVVLSLAHGGDRCAGTVQLDHGGRRASVCEDSWGAKEADVVCRELGCGNKIAFYKGEMFPSDGVELLSLNCMGDEQYFWQCAHNITGKPCTSPAATSVVCSDHVPLRVVNGTDACHGSLEVRDGMNLSNPAKICEKMHCGSNGMFVTTGNSKKVGLNCSDTVKILLGHSNDCYGPVRVARAGQEGAVCANEWNEEDGKVVCRELGCGELVSVSSGSWNTAGWVDRVQCKGKESSLWHCLAKHHKLQPCSEARVVCADSVKVRLADGTGRCAGRVEISYDGQWMGAAAEGWTSLDSDRVCGDLSCGAGYSSNTNIFSRGGVSVFPKTLSCSKKHKTLAQCITKKQRTKEDIINVICTDHRSVQLEGGPGPCSGLVSVRGPNETWWLSGESWEEAAATVVCRQLHCGNPAAFERRPNGSRSLWTKRYTCSSNETTLFDCPSTPVATNTGFAAFLSCSGLITVKLGEQCSGAVTVCLSATCGVVSREVWKSEQAELVCQELNCGKAMDPVNPPSRQDQVLVKSVHCTGQETVLGQCGFVLNTDTQYRTEPAFVVCAKSVKARLLDARDQCSGQVQVYHSGGWRPVCSATLNNKELRTICNELGCGKPDVNGTVATYLPVNGKGMKSVKCKESAGRLSDCTFGPELQSCNLAGLRCSGWRRMLFTGSRACSGELFVLDAAGLHPVSLQRFTKSAAGALCQQLGCGAFRNLSHSPSDLRQWWNSSYDCSRTAGSASVWECEARASGAAGNLQAFVECSGDVTAQLAQRHSRCSGEVRIGADGQVCGRPWGAVEAATLCKELRCSAAVPEEAPARPPLRAPGYSVICSGKESALWQCKTGRVQSCVEGAVTVACADSVEVKVSGMCGGTVLVRYRSEWEGVCPLNWGSREAQLLCQHLNCGPPQNLGQTEVQDASVHNSSLDCLPGAVLIKHCVRGRKCQAAGSGVVYCQGYVPKQSGKSPVSLIVGLLLGLGILIAAGILIAWFWKNRRTRNKGHSIKRRSVFTDSVSEYEEVPDNDSGTTDVMLKDLQPRPGSETSALQVIGTSKYTLSRAPVPGADVERGLRASNSSLTDYDDVAEGPLEAPPPPAGARDRGETGREHPVTGGVTPDPEPGLQPEIDDDDVTAPPEALVDSGAAMDGPPEGGDGEQVQNPKEEDYVEPDIPAEDSRHIRRHWLEAVSACGGIITLNLN